MPSSSAVTQAAHQAAGLPWTDTLAVTDDIAATSDGAQASQLSQATASPVQSRDICIEVFCRLTILNSPFGILDERVPGLTMTSGPSATLYEASMVVPLHIASQPDASNLRVALPISPAGRSIDERSARSLTQSPLALTSAITSVEGQKAEPDSPRVIAYSESNSNHSGMCHSPSETWIMG